MHGSHSDHVQSYVSFLDSILNNETPFAYCLPLWLRTDVVNAPWQSSRIPTRGRYQNNGNVKCASERAQSDFGVVASQLKAEDCPLLYSFQFLAGELPLDVIFRGSIQGK